MRNFITQNLVVNFDLAFRISAVVGFIFNIVPDLSGWFNANIDYVRLAMLVVAIDHALGSFVHSKAFKDDFNWKKNITGFGVKLSMIVAFAILMEAIAHITIEDDLIYRYIKMSGRLLVIIYPALSAMRNIKIVTGGDFPSDAIVGKFEGFTKDLDINKLRNKKDNE